MKSLSLKFYFLCWSQYGDVDALVVSGSKKGSALVEYKDANAAVSEPNDYKFFLFFHLTHNFATFLLLILAIGCAN